MDDGLNRFEQDLKSLTPKPYPSASPARTMLPIHDYGATSLPGVGVVRDQQLLSLNSTHRNWLKTVAVSWATGLAAGLLISAFWTKMMKEETAITEPSLLTENSSAAGVIEPDTPLNVSKNSSSKTTSRQQPLATQPITAQRSPGFVGNTRRTSLNSPEQEILHPFMTLNNVNWNAAMLPSSKRFAGAQSRTNQTSEQANAPDSASGDSQKSIPVSIPKTQGQRELLKSLMESDDLISI